MENNENIQEENPQLKPKSNKTIKIIIAVITLIVGVGLVCFGYNSFINKDKTKKEESNKTNNLITKDTLFLCPDENDDYDYDGNGILEFVKASDNKHENEVCDGKFAGKYVCTNKNCDFKFMAQSFSGYSDYNKGIATIYDNNEEHYNGKGFLYDFKNSKKLTEEMGFSDIVYHDDTKYYFVVYKDNGDGLAILDSQGNMTIDFNKYDSISICEGCSAPDGEGSIRDNGVIIVQKDNKYGFVDLTTGEETTKIEFDQYGFVKYNNDPHSSDVETLVSWVEDEMANRNLKEIYVVSNNVGKIINFKTGEVVRELNKVYTYAFPLSDDLVLVEDGKTLDILDKNNKSILKKKLSFSDSVFLSWDNENYDWTNYDFKKFKIIIANGRNSTEHGYIFDIDSRTLTEY